MAQVILPGQRRQQTRTPLQQTVSIQSATAKKRGIINVFGRRSEAATDVTLKNGCLFSLSLQQMRILDLLTSRFRIMRTDDLPWILLRLRPSRRVRERSLSNSERASLSRTIRRLRVQRLVAISRRPFRMAVSELGSRVVTVCRRQPFWSTYSLELGAFDADER